MPTTTSVTKPVNQLLALLPPADYQRLVPKLYNIPLPIKQVLYKARGPIEFVYFPVSGFVSAMTRMLDGAAIEVATIGREGMVGLTAFIGGMSSPNEMMVQVGGDGVRMPVETLKDECSRDSALRRILVRYHTAYSTQISYGVACNGLHKIEQRCCRWLLMSADRIESDTLPLTHEFLGIMLGVRRSSVTEVLQLLQDRGLISTGRGAIRILNRDGLMATSCECYQAINDEFKRQFG